jgi:hypothetical protein
MLLLTVGGLLGVVALRGGDLCEVDFSRSRQVGTPDALSSEAQRELKGFFGDACVTKDGKINTLFRDQKGNTLLQQAVMSGAGVIFSKGVLITGLPHFLIEKVEMDPFVENNEKMNALDLLVRQIKSGQKEHCPLCNLQGIIASTALVYSKVYSKRNDAFELLRRYVLEVLDYAGELNPEHGHKANFYALEIRLRNKLCVW